MGDEENTEIKSNFSDNTNKIILVEHTKIDPNSHDMLMTEPNKIDTSEEEFLVIEAKNKDKRNDKLLTKKEILKKVSYGTGFREALNNIVSGEMGAIIFIQNANSANLYQGGFRINSKFTAKRLTELAKMDGAIVLSEDFKKIFHANALLTPNKNITTLETGTRHQAAERTAKQTGGMVIAVSERLGKITVYYGNAKYVLENTESLLRRATETLQILDKQKDVLNELIINLNLLEINNLVSVSDVCLILEKFEMVNKMIDILDELLTELGKEGTIVLMRKREITRGIDKERELIIKDYISGQIRAKAFFNNISFEGLLDLSNMAKVLLKKAPESNISPKGYRILNKTSLSKDKIQSLIKHFKTLENILNSDKEAIKKILKTETDKFFEEVNTLREHSMLGKKI